MADTSTTTHYSLYAQIFHWFTVILVVGAWVLGIFGDDLPRGAIRHYGEFIHIIFGEAVLLLHVLRLALRFVTIQPVSEPQIIPFMGYTPKLFTYCRTFFFFQSRL